MQIKNNHYAIGIAGSPRYQGNSTSLLKAYLSGASAAGFETKIIYLNSLAYRGCQACDSCVKGKMCRIKDDLCEIFPLLQKADIWAMASPIYYDGISGQLKTFFDRLRFTTYDPYKLKGARRGILIVTYEDDRREFYFETASHLANYFSWHNRGDFGEVKVVAEPNLGPRNAWEKRPDLLIKLKGIGREHAKELKELQKSAKSEEEEFK
jgi:multimeric flavodoxin WrbA